VQYTYVLLTEADGKFYTGATSDLRKRLRLHAAGRVASTVSRRPLRPIYYEGCLSADDAYRRERYLKSGRGGRYLKARLASSLADIRANKLERH
jgi:putative endonuclease